MAYKQVDALEADFTYSLGKLNKTTGKKDPSQVEGYYLGNREVEGGKFGKSVLHFLKTPRGNAGVWGGTDMNKKLAAVTPGVMVRITAAGKKPTPKGDMNVFTVEVDTDTVLDGYVAPQYSQSAIPESYSDVEEPILEEDNGIDEDALQAEALAALERQQKVQALLNKNRKVASK